MTPCDPSSEVMTYISYIHRFSGASVVFTLSTWFKYSMLQSGSCFHTLPLMGKVVHYLNKLLAGRPWIVFARGPCIGTPTASLDWLELCFFTQGCSRSERSLSKTSLDLLHVVQNAAFDQVLYLCLLFSCLYFMSVASVFYCKALCDICNAATSIPSLQVSALVWTLVICWGCSSRSGHWRVLCILHSKRRKNYDMVAYTSRLNILKIDNF